MSAQEDNWQAEQYMDECVRRAEALAALRVARSCGVPERELMTLAYECGMASDFYKEIRSQP